MRDKPADLDKAIATYAAAIATALDVDLHIVHNVPRTAYPLGEVTAADRRRMRERMHAKLNRLLKKAGASARHVHVLQGTVDDNVPQLARKLPAQILAMGIISRRWVQRFAIGDTAESMICAAPCDVLVIKPAEFRLRLGRSRKQEVVLPRA